MSDVKRRRGRPSKGLVPLGLRVSREFKAKLDDQVARTGHSQSQQAEYWMMIGEMVQNGFLIVSMSAKSPSLAAKDIVQTMNGNFRSRGASIRVIDLNRNELDLIEECLNLKAAIMMKTNAAPKSIGRVTLLLNRFRRSLERTNQ